MWQGETYKRREEGTGTASGDSPRGEGGDIVLGREPFIFEEL
jgi:hypothetical protein